MAINIYLVEDHPTFQYILVSYRGRFPDFLVCGIASSSQEALAQIAQAQPDLVVIDIFLPDISGIAVVSELHIRHPALAILMLSSSQEAHYVHYAIKAGARGFVVKGDPYEIELDIRNVLTGKAYISPQLHIHP